MYTNFYFLIVPRDWYIFLRLMFRVLFDAKTFVFYCHNDVIQHKIFFTTRHRLYAELLKKNFCRIIKLEKHHANCAVTSNFLQICEIHFVEFLKKSRAVKNQMLFKITPENIEHLYDKTLRIMFLLINNFHCMSSAVVITSSPIGYNFIAMCGICIFHDLCLAAAVKEKTQQNILTFGFEGHFSSV